MMAAAARAPAADAATFRLGPLTTYADPAAMAAWLEAASAGDQMIYATGPMLGDHPAVVLARVWQGKGAVHLFQRKGERAHCTDYCVEKRPGAKNAPAPLSRGGMGKASRADIGRLARLLRGLAARGAPCPSFAELARRLDLPRGSRGRRRAQYLIETLEREGRVRIDRSGGRATIVISNGRSKPRGETQ